MKNIFYVFGMLLVLIGCQDEKSVQVNISNSTDLDRLDEIVEISMEEIAGKLQLTDTAEIVILDESGRQMPYQITFDNKIIFPASVKAKGQADYTIKAGIPELFTVSVCGKQYLDNNNELAWENDRITFNICGPRSETVTEDTSGYDVWVKKSDELLLNTRFENQEHQENDYKAGLTLGVGASALYVDEAIVYPLGYQTEEILDNGPLRFTVMLTCEALIIKEDSAVVETRIISLDKGSQLNKTLIYYKNLKNGWPLVTGIALHATDEENSVSNAKEGYMGYADSANSTQGSGTVYIGAVFPSNVKETKTMLFAPVEARKRKASGYLLALNDYLPESDYIYYWGAGWSKYGFDGMESWTQYLKKYAQKVRNPLIVTLK